MTFVHFFVKQNKVIINYFYNLSRVKILNSVSIQKKGRMRVKKSSLFLNGRNSFFLNVLLL